MKFVVVDNIPGRRARKANLQEKIHAFADGEYNIVKLEFEESEYKSPTVAAQVISVAAKRSGRAVKVTQRGDNVYLMKIISE